MPTRLPLRAALAATVLVLAGPVAGHPLFSPPAFPPEPPRTSRPLADGTFRRDSDGRATGGQTVSVAAAERPLRLAILPDRTTGRDWGLPYLRQAVDDLRRIRPDAAFTIGDMVQGYTRSTDRYDRETETYLAIVESLPMPLFPIAGNHDTIPGTRDPSDRRFIERYRETFAPLHYAVEFDRATVLVLFADAANGDGPPRLDATQLAWLADALPRAEARGRPILVLVHRPLWRSSGSRWDELVHPLLARHGVAAVIAGHFHAMQRDPDRDGVAYHILAACGGMIDQHPLAGQLQHLTFVQVDADGTVSIHHQPVGVTLDADFIRTGDQERAYRLKSEAGLVELPAAAPDPVRGPVEVRLPIRGKNPLEVPIELELSAVTAWPGREPVEGLPIVTDVRIDAFNPFVTDLATPFVLELPAPMRLGPGETFEASIAVRCAAHAASPPPPEILATARFLDERGRIVPVWVARRLPILREIPLAAAPTPAFPLAADRAFPIASWTPSPYDTLEPNPTAAIGLEGDRLRIDLEVPDRHRPDDPLAPPPGTRRVTDPPHDAIRILLPDGPEGERELLFEPFAPGQGTLMAVGPGGSLREVPGFEIDAFAVDGDAWRIALRLPGRFRPKPGDRMNLGVADNDETYHTQWRWLAPEAFPARFVESGRP